MATTPVAGPTAGHRASITANSVAITTSDNGTEVCGIKSIDFGQNAELLDVTSFCDEQYRKRILGLRDATLSLSGDFNPTDAGQAFIRANFDSGTDLFIAYYPVFTDTAATDFGFTAKFQVQDYNVTSAVDGLTEVSFTLMQAGDVSLLV